MSCEQAREYTIPNEFKKLTCQAWGCEHNLKPICSHGWIELNERGECIFNTTGTVKHPISGERFTIFGC